MAENLNLEDDCCSKPWNIWFRKSNLVQMARGWELLAWIQWWKNFIAGEVSGCHNWSENSWTSEKTEYFWLPRHCQLMEKYFYL